MISLKELYTKYKPEQIPDEHKANLLILLDRVNIIRAAFKKPMYVTSCYRSKEDQIRIYKEKGVTDLTKIPMSSKHMSGAAVDFEDPVGTLKQFITKNKALLEKANLWAEDFRYTPTWVHLQCEPFKSYKAGKTRFFVP